MNGVNNVQFKEFREFSEYPPILHAKHVQEMLGVSHGKAYEIINSQKCPTIKMGKRYVVLRDAFIQFLNANQGADLLEGGKADG